MSALDKQEGGDHYKKLKIQPVEYIVANEIPFREGNVIKYVTRWKDKGGFADIRKAIHFLQMILEEEHQPEPEVENTMLNTLPEGYRFLSKGDVLGPGVMVWDTFIGWTDVDECKYGWGQHPTNKYICPTDPT